MLGSSNSKAERLPVSTVASLVGIEYDALETNGGGYTLQFPENDPIVNFARRFPSHADESEIVLKARSEQAVIRLP